MTLLDYPGKVACTVFFGGCDFRCPFCHNFELVDGSADPIMEEEELLSFLKKRKGLLDGVAFTGGEPCLQKDLPELLFEIKAMGYKIKLDTNGNHPKMLRSLLDDCLLDYVAMDIKNSPEKYAETIGLTRFDLGKVKESIGLLMNSGIDHEFRTTVVDEFHSEKDFPAIGRMIQGARQYFLQAFTDRDSVPFGDLHAPEAAKMKAFADIVRPYVQHVEIRGMDL